MGIMNVLSKFFRLDPPMIKSNSENKFNVTITDTYVRVEHPKRKTEEIFWTDIQQIWFLNTDAGPANDVWLVLEGKESGCVIPQDAEGCNKVYEIVSKYEGFNHENVIKSMGCTDDARFLLWTRTRLTT